MKLHSLIGALIIALPACKTVNPVGNPIHQDGYEAGNGGNVVVCRDPQAAIESVELLDFYEGRESAAKHYPALGPSGMAQIEKARYALNRLGRLDPERSAAYKKVVEGFFGNATFVKDQILPDTKDYGWVSVPANCRIEQIAVQQRPKERGETHYTINQDLWNLLTSDHQAGLILHEVVYRDALGKGHKNSINTRHFNSVLASNQFTTMEVASYRDMLDRLALGDAPVAEHPPYWVMNPIPIGGCVDRPVESNLAAFAHDPNGRALTFSLTDGPSWGRIEAGGMFRGTPDISAYGENKFRARVTNGQGLTAETELRVGITKCATGGPKWVADPIDLGAATEDVAFAFDLKSLVKDPTGGRIEFAATGLPAWLRLDVNGTLTGTPVRPDVGEFRDVRISATGVGGTSTVSAHGTVLHVHHPARWTSGLIALPSMKAGHLATIDLSRYVLNPEGSALTYQVAGGIEMISLTASGILRLTPRYNEIGDQSFTLWLRDGEAGDRAEFHVQVVKDARPPVWLQSPVTLPDAGAGNPYLATLTSFVFDPDGEPLSFQKISGPSWMTISAQGAVIGTPAKADTGGATMVVRASNPSGLGAETTVTINVK